MPLVDLKDVGRRLGDLSDLPPELRSQIKAAQLDDLEEKILKTLKERFGGVATVDEMIVGLYRDHQYVAADRRALANKLYRMQKADLLVAIPKRKGVYAIKDEEADADDGSDLV